MKNIFKAIGLIAAMLAIYYAAQAAATTILFIPRMITMVSDIVRSGAAPDVGQLTRDMMSFAGTLTPWILLIAVAITLPLYYLFYRGRRQELWTFARFKSIQPVAVPVLVVFALALNVIIDVLLGLLQQLPALKHTFDVYDQLAGFITGGSFTLSLLAVGIVGPIFEELLFRGLIFGELRKISTVRLALVIQALLFGIYHMNTVQGTYAFVIGLLLGYVYYRSNSIWAPIIMHISINSSSVVLGQFVGGDTMGTWGGAVVIASLLLFAITGVFILKHRSFGHVMDDSLYQMNRAPKLPPDGGGRPY
jgi:membrane protease YdiL (CAAX protease family)